MRDWFTINLGDAMLAYAQQDRIKQFLLSAYADAGSPDEMAAFTRHESEGCLHCEVIIYLSPMSISVAKQLNAQACERPSPADLSLLAGAQDSWTVLFSELTR